MAETDISPNKERMKPYWPKWQNYQNHHKGFLVEGDTRLPLIKLSRRWFITELWFFIKLDFKALTEHVCTILCCSFICRGRKLLTGSSQSCAPILLPFLVRWLKMATQQRVVLFTSSGYLLLPSHKIILELPPAILPKAGSTAAACAPTLKEQVPNLQSYTCKHRTTLLPVALPLSLGRGKPTNLQRKLWINPKLKALDKITG